MPAEHAPPVVKALVRDYLASHPEDVARLVENLPRSEITRFLGSTPVAQSTRVFERLTPGMAPDVLRDLEPDAAAEFVGRIDPAHGATLLSRLSAEARGHVMTSIEPELRAEIEQIMNYPPDSAGTLMDPAVIAFSPGATVNEALARLRRDDATNRHAVFLVDGDGKLAGRVSVVELAVAAAEARLEVLADRSPASIQAMVDASRDETALSTVSFAVRKRLPWLEINLLTAFLAASVVGLFEGTIAKFTALAVLLPVVAGQSGNTDAQALAVAMRGLALREYARDIGGGLRARK